MVYVVESYIFIFSAFFWIHVFFFGGFRPWTLVVRVFFSQKIQVKTSVADLIVRQPQSDRLGQTISVSVIWNNSNGLDDDEFWSWTYGACKSTTCFSERYSVNLPSCGVFGMIRSALRCRKQKVRKKLIGRGPCPGMCFFTERFRQIEIRCYPVVVGLFDETKRQILFRLRSWNLQSRGRSLLPIDSELCNKVKKIVQNTHAQKYIEKSNIKRSHPMKLWQMSAVTAWQEWRFHSLRLCLSGNHPMSLSRRIHLIGIGQMKWCAWHLQSVATFFGFSKLVPLTIGNGSTLNHWYLSNSDLIHNHLQMQSGSAQGSSMWQSLLGYAQMRFASQIFHGSLGRWAPCDSRTECCGWALLQGWL